MLPSRLRLAVLATIAALGLGGCATSATGTDPVAGGANRRDGTRATFCAGRFVIDVPAGSTLSGGTYRYDFIRIDPVKPATREAFEHEVEQRAGTLSAGKHKRTGGNMLLHTEKPGKDARILASWEANVITAAIIWETQGQGTLDTPAVKIELTTGRPDSNGKPQRTALTDWQAIALWNEIVSSLRLRPTGG